MLIHAKNIVFWLLDPISRPQDPARDHLEPLGWHTVGSHLGGTGLPQVMNDGFNERFDEPFNERFSDPLIERFNERGRLQSKFRIRSAK